jgi:ribosomal protein S18 acetylase RimI-like enzyme
MTEAARIERGGVEQIDELEPLWTSLQDHHAELDAVPAIRARDDSWSRRRRQYERWLSERGGYLFIARDGERAVGYLMLRLGDGPATWEIGDRAGEVETLAVLPEARSSGVGKALIDAAAVLAESEGVTALGVGVAHSNAGALRFYERVGFKPFYVEMLRIER